MAFKSAVKKKMLARVAIDGPTGSGKTYTGLKLIRALVGEKGRIAVIDTEHKTAAKYLGDAIDTFDVDEFDTFEPQRYIDAIKAAAKEGYDGLLVDSYSHAWAGKGGALEMVDNAAAAAAGKGWGGGKKDSFSAWREVTPIHNELVETLIRFPGHLVVTMRSKMAYEKTADGKIQKLGMQPIQRDGVEYEFDIVMDMDVKHTLIINKSRCRALDGKVFKKPDGNDIATPLLKWLDDGAVTEVQTPAAPNVEEVAAANVSKAIEVLDGKVESVKPLPTTPAEQASIRIGEAKSVKELASVASFIKGLKGITVEERKLLLVDYTATKAKLAALAKAG